MKLVKNEKLENNRQELQFSIDADAFNAAVDEAFKRESVNYNIPRFRKGKAPRHMIEKMYCSDVFHYPAINDLFPDAYEAAVKESGIEPVDRPEAVSYTHLDVYKRQALRTAALRRSASRTNGTFWARCCGASRPSINLEQ